AADAFVAGVNAYIAEVKAAPDKSPYIPHGAETVLGLLYGSPNFGPWSSSDIFALGRFQSTSLSFDSDDIGFSTRLAKVQALYGTDPASNKRAGAFVDLFTILPARKVYTRAGLGSAAPKQAARAAPMHLPSLESLQAARAFADGQKQLLGLL